MPDTCTIRWLLPLLSGASVFAVVCAEAQEFTFHGALTSDYVYRGVSNSDEGAALQLGVDMSTEIGFFAGVWASTTDITTGNRSRNRDREVDYYVGYVRYFDNDWSASLSVNRYTYPGATGDVNYDYNEFSGIVGFDGRVWLELDYTDSVFGHDAAAYNIEILANWPLPFDLLLATGVGYFDVSRFAASDYSHWQVGISRSLAWATFDIRYHDTDDVPTRVSPNNLADPRIVLSISAAF